jgi:PAS domain S-box-containing protein/putative nucleotidyltransferase with HDIG domain
VGVALMETATGRFLMVNQQYCDIVGLAPEEMTATTFMAITHPDDLQANLENMGKLRDGLSRQFSLEERYHREDGSQVWVNLTVSPMWREGEAPNHHIAVVEDITKRKMAEAQVKRGLDKLHRTLLGTVAVLANIVATKDPYTAGHQRRVAQLACAMARELGWSEDRVEGMQVQGLLHDLGKIAVPTEILSRPGKISQVEFSLIKSHPAVGYDILKSIEFPWPVAQTVLQHHERLNGTGDPAGLNAGEIIPEARVLAVADVVEAMSSHRPYRPGLGIETALKEITNHKGTLYDPEAVDACVRLFTGKGFAFDTSGQF